MTSPSRRKLPIIPPSMRTSASATGAAAAVVWLLAAGVAPVRSEGPGLGGHVPSSAFLDVLASPTEPLAAGRGSSFLDASNKLSAGRAKTGSRAKSSVAARGKRGKYSTRGVRPAGFNPEFPGTAGSAEFSPRFDDVPESPEVAPLPGDSPTALVEELDSSRTFRDPPGTRVSQAPQPQPTETIEEGVEDRRARVQSQLTRPFKQMKQIRPFFDYEPDTTEADVCFNLCPRPGSPDCPDCEKPDLEGGPQGRLVCPECPEEINLRETARLVGSVNDSPTRNFAHIHYCWEPTNLYAYPLYFEDHCLERYGHTRHYLIQPPFSVMLFCAQFVGLPYQMTIDPVFKKRYALGWYRPGQFVPYKYYQVPWNTEAALVEAGVLAGSYFLFAPGVGP